MVPVTLVGSEPADQTPAYNLREAGELADMSEATVRKYIRELGESTGLIIPTWDKETGERQIGAPMIPVLKQIKSLRAELGAKVKKGDMAQADVLPSIAETIRAAVEAEHDRLEQVPEAQVKDLEKIAGLVLTRLDGRLKSQNKEQLEQLLRTMTEEYGRACRELGQAEAKLDTLEQLLLESKSQLKLLPAQAESLITAQHKQLWAEEAARRAERQAEQAREAEAEVSGELAQAQAQIRELERQADGLQGQIAQRDLELQALQRREQELTAERQAQRQELEQLRADQAQRQAAERDQALELERAKARIGSLETELQAERDAHEATRKSKKRWF